ncbi:DUF4132 domain-containing protein [Streptomyces sp. NPDC090445]|uniref:DUF4132 domain-containing protein n=1 Tax=Streptomyces sp. NPDC090445 TaxID=3365963 RepID=UPI0037F3E414
MQRWEYVGDGSAKFWEGGVDGTSVTLRFGRTGTTGQTQVKDFGTAEEARAYFAKAVATREKKGYAQVGDGEADTPGSAAAPEARATATTTATATATATADDGADGPQASAAARTAPARVDEDVFELPEAWKRNVLPRRGGVSRPTSAMAAAPALADAWLEQEAELVARVLDFPQSDPVLVAAARAHLAGTPDPLGAAVLAHLVRIGHGGNNQELFVDAWAVRHGLPFAARAAVEFGQIVPGWHTDPRSGVIVTGVCWITDANGRRHAKVPTAPRARQLLASAAEAEYRAAVEALAGHRDTPRRRGTVSFIVPGELDWVSECCADPLPSRDGHFGELFMLAASLGTAEHVAAVRAAGFDLGWYGWSAELIATCADGLGTALAPLLADPSKLSWISTDALRSYAEALAELPSDIAFRALLGRIDDKAVRPALLTAAGRYPVRALRLFAESAEETSVNASLARRLLKAHVATHRELALDVLPELPAGAADLVGRLARRDGQLAEADAAALPEVLTSPPWTRVRPRTKPRTVAGLSAPEDTRTAWLPGEQEEWADAENSTASWASHLDLEKLAAEQRAGRLGNDHQTLALFTLGPADVLGPLLAEWDGPDWSYEGTETFMPLIARYEADALRMALGLASRLPATMGVLLMPYVNLRTARLMADWLVRLKSAGRTARAWLVRHAGDAAALLVPDALGEPGKPRTAAEAALRAIATAHGPDTVREAAAGYGPQAVEAMAELLDADPLVTALPAKTVEPGAWADPAALPQLKLRTGEALPAEATGHLLRMMAFSTPGSLYPGVEQVREIADPAAFAEFGWAVFDEWRLAGMPAKDAWALHQLGGLGDNDTVRLLAPIIRNWPGEGAHHRAVDGLDVLAAIGTDNALLSLHAIAQRAKFKALKARAGEKIAEVAAGLGLTGEQLSDRLVPDFGLDADGTTTVDYGSRRFIVGFDEQLKPYVADTAGKRLKDLPKPGVKDDPELAPAERKRFAALKKDVRAIAADQVRRLEAAMVDGRTWTAEEFRMLFAEHPLVWHLARRLVWRAVDGDATAEFRIAEDRSLADAEDDTFTLGADAVVSLPHPLHLGTDTVAAWSELFADYEILQPFPQLGRAVYAVTEEEAAGHRLTRFEGITVPVGRLLGLTKRGWERGSPEDNGVERWISRRLGRQCYLVIAPDEGIAVGMVDTYPDQTLETVWLDTTPGDYWCSHSHPLTFADLDPVTASEVLTDLTELTA